MAEQHRRLSGAPAAEVIESQSKRVNEQSHYRRYEHAYGAPAYPAPPQNAEELSLPVMLCHTCSHCGRMRSVGFHRNNPVLPGKPLVSQLCHRCEKKYKSQCYSSYTRIRSCTADVPCNWPREPVHFDVERSEHRGRTRHRDELYVAQHSPDQPHIIQRSSSQMHLGLSALQQPSRKTKTETRVRVSSLSPHHHSRYDKVWPSPDVVSMRPSRSNDVLSTDSESISGGTRRTTEVWPPPDVVCTHMYRKIDKTHPRLSRVSSRIIELSPSPSPPPQSRTGKGTRRNTSQSHHSRSRSPSPTQVRFRKTRRSESAEARITAHPRPYRPSLLDHHTIDRGSNANSNDNGYMTGRLSSSTNGCIFKSEGRAHETWYRQASSIPNSQQSLAVEVGGPRVQFSTRKQDSSSVAHVRDKTGRSERASNMENYKHYSGYSPYRRVESPTSPAPPTKKFEELRFRYVSPKPRKQDEDRSRSNQSSSSPSPVRLREDKASSHQPSRVSLSPQRSKYSGYRHVSRTGTMSHPRTVAPPMSRHKQQVDDSDDMTGSESTASGGITEVRSWKGIDEQGKPAIFVEEKRVAKMIEPEHEQGLHSRALNVRLASKSWRDV